MDSQYSESLVGDDYSESSMETHAEDDSSITTEDRDENSSEEEQSSITTEDSSEEEIDPWSTLINDAASKVQERRHLASRRFSWRVVMKAKRIKEEAFEKILPVFQKELGDVYMDNLAWMKALKKDPTHKKIMATRDDYVNNDMFDPDEAIAAAVKKRTFLLKRLLEGQGRFPEQ